MLNRLRWQLTILYLLAALGLVALIGGGSYTLLRLYYQNTTDLAIQYKMALQFEAYGIPLPAELAKAEQAWLNSNPSFAHQASPTAAALLANTATQLPPTLSPTPVTENTDTGTPTAVPTGTATPIPLTPTLPGTNLGANPSGGEGEGDGSDDQSENKEGSHSPEIQTAEQPAVIGTLSVSTITPAPTRAGINQASHKNEDTLGEDSYDARLAPIFVVPLKTNGEILSNLNSMPAPMVIDEAARLAAMSNGYDWRTIQLSDGARVRLLTYRTSSPNGPAMFQIGRALSDQDRTLNQFLMGLIFLSAFGSIVLGMGSWWLSGKTIGPAQKAWEQQQIFISNASHELRTPLTFIRASAEVGLRESTGTPTPEVLQDIVSESDYMNQLVDDLLLLSRLDTHRLSLNLELISLPQLLSEVYRKMDLQAKEKGISLTIENAQGKVRGDSTRLRQVLLILLDNALRYTPSGGSVQVKTQPKGKHILISIQDTGLGIPKEHLPHVFERFYQVPQPVSDPTRSNGLGLSIARALVEAQGGSIHIESQEGKGTQVMIELPGRYIES